MRFKDSFKSKLFMLVLCALIPASAARAQTTAFSYQGTLTEADAPVTRPYLNGALSLPRRADKMPHVEVRVGLEGATR